jgi:hypothetical protein
MNKSTDVVEIENKKGKNPKYEVGGPSKTGPKKKNYFKKKVISHYCKKSGHFIKDCRVLKKKEQANNVEENIVVVISEVNMVVNASGWWADTGATRHICGEKNLFQTYEEVGDEIELYMGNSTTTKVVLKGKVELKFTSGKVVTLIDVFYALKIRKNLVFGCLFSKHDYKLVFELDKFDLTKNSMFMGKGYVENGMFKLNLIKENASIYIVDSFLLWHARLGHVNYNSVNRMGKLGLLPSDLHDDRNKCETCVKTN